MVVAAAVFWLKSIKERKHQNNISEKKQCILYQPNYSWHDMPTTSELGFPLVLDEALDVRENL